jgi:hypothetical protein
MYHNDCKQCALYIDLLIRRQRLGEGRCRAVWPWSYHHLSGN